MQRSRRPQGLGLAAVAITKARCQTHERNGARTAAGAVRYLEPALIPTAAGVWVYALHATVAA